jgi:tRNA 2-thiouridine synthesizing protein A
MVNKYLNANDLDCPLPLLKTKLTLADLKSGQILEVTATDPTSWADFASYAKMSLFMQKRTVEYLFTE